MSDGRPLFAFAHIEKCGGTTLIETLRRNFPFGHIDMIPVKRESELVGEVDLARALTLQPWLRSFAGHSVRPQSDFGTFTPRIRMFTLLRDPTKRFVSDYLHDVSKRCYTKSITDYLTHPNKHNFIVKSLAGGDDLEGAKEVLTNKIEYYGFVERYDQFMLGLRDLFNPLSFDPAYVHVNYAMLKKSQKAGQAAERPTFSDTELSAVREANQLDQSLYDWALLRLETPIEETAELQKEGLSATEKTALFANRAVRNFWYKPMLGYRPGSMHALPRNSDNVDVLSGQNS